MTIVAPGLTVHCLPIGSPISIGNIEAMVIGLLFRGADVVTVEYDIAWIHNGERKTAWVHQHEVTSLRNKIPVGFANDLDR